jgi:hypothetical protein
MAKLFIPACGDRITVTQPWNINLILESRNLNYAKEIGVPLDQYKNTGYSWRAPLDSVPVTVEPGTVLECDRVYIRAMSKRSANADDSYDSVTWKVVVNGKAVQKRRFWVKLSDCSNLEFDEASISKYRDRK